MSVLRPLPPIAAGQHADLRRKQSYTVSMMVEESRLLQVCLIGTLHKSASELDFAKLLPDVVTIAEELDAHSSSRWCGIWRQTRFKIS
jgi:hypothetical protein